MYLTMITKVTIRDNKRLTCQYAEGLEAFANGKCFEFKKGVNIIIGKNGSGKSTLLKLISDMMLCSKSHCSMIPQYFLLGEPFGRDGELMDGADISSDYAGVVYNLISTNEMTKDDILGRASNAVLYMEEKKSSMGEKQNLLLGTLFSKAFSNMDTQFPIKELKKMDNRKQVRELLEYYRRNRVEMKREDFEFTFLLDEPDRNLDITNIDRVYDILSFHKEYTQLICVIHNPVLIYRLSKLDHINWIEMTEGYLDQVKEIFAGL